MEKQRIFSGSGVDRGHLERFLKESEEVLGRMDRNLDEISAQTKATEDALSIIQADALNIERSLKSIDDKISRQES